MAFTRTRRTKEQRWYRLACGHTQFGDAGEPWERVKCLQCGETTKVVSEQGPPELEDLLRF